MTERGWLVANHITWANQVAQMDMPVPDIEGSLEKRPAGKPSHTQHFANRIDYQAIVPLTGAIRQSN